MARRFEGLPTLGELAFILVMQAFGIGLALLVAYGIPRSLIPLG